MEDTARSFETVHVLRHGFRPSEPLAVGIENFIKAGVTVPRFLLLGSKQIAIHHDSYYDKSFLAQLSAAQREFSKDRQEVHLANDVHIKILGNGALRFQMFPSDLVSFHDTLDKLERLPHLPRTLVGPERYFLQVTIAANMLAGEDAREHAEAKLRRGLALPQTNNLYTVRPVDIPEKITEVAIRPRLLQEQ